MPSSHDLDALLAILKQRLADGKLDEPAYRQCEQLLRERGSPMSDTGEAAPASPSDLKPGPVLLDRWLIVRLLGRGGFGEVFEAIDLDRRQSQAVKLLEPRMLAREEYLTRFRREFEIMRELEHPRVVRVYEYREEPEQQLALISMEHVAGGTVSDLVTLARHQEQPVPLPLALRIAGQTIEALVAAHRREVLHRDVTPRNILLAGGPAAELVADAQRDPQVKLVDFGIAGLVKPSTFSQTSRAMGTMGYVAPEMFSPAPRVTPAADLYGVAAVTYELVTGQLPVGRFESPSELRAGLPATVAETLDSLLLDLLRRNPDERPDAEAALARFQAVEKQWEVERARRRESETRQQAVEEAGPRTVPRSRRSKHVRPPRWLRYAFSGLALIGVIAVVFYIASGIASFKIPPREVSPPMESSDGASSESADGPSVESRTETPAATSPVATPPADDSEGSSEGPSSEPADALSVESPAETPAVTFPVATPAGGDSQKSTEGPSNEPADGPTVESLPETPPAMSPVATPPGDDSLESSEGPSNEPADALRVESPAETPPATSPVATPPADDSQKSTEGPSNE
ncbi:MAG: protein kinase, partial [bacterium]|nr:protein kinase [bacterium]